jgi:transglutaminase-like putative cysteine protease
MQYDIRLSIHYEYDHPVGGGRHLIRVLPLNLAGVQRVVAASLAVTPTPAERSDFSDFFENHVSSIAVRKPHDELDVRMSARVAVTRPEPGLDVSPLLDQLGDELASVWSLAPGSPHHFTTASEHAGIDRSITSYARQSFGRRRSVESAATHFCNRINADFAYDTEATTVATRAADAFELKRGVCQDFTHIMIAGLRGLGVPAGYVSGFLRTIPPPGKERLEGADAMHAWVRVWCGRESGWLEFDPTNGMRAGDDHITVAIGRDYSDVAPIVGIVKIAGGQAQEQSVDVVPVAEMKWTR